MKSILKKIISVLSFTITIILVILAGCSVLPTENPVPATAKEKRITLKPDPDFIITIPANWKNKYIIKKSKNKKHQSYVSFSAKKYYKETGDGWLFSIHRYKDDSYTDLPEYELAGKWGNFNYIAVFPTDIQTFGASKAAKKQYLRMAGDTISAAFSICPAKKREEGTNIYRASGFSLDLPATWKHNYMVQTGGKTESGSYVAFYAKKCYEEMGEGFLFAIGRYTDDSYQELPYYKLAGKWNGISYVAIFPTDVQFAGATQEAVKQYQTLNKSVEKVALSIWR